jgi:hypothetical protein
MTRSTLIAAAVILTACGGKGDQESGDTGVQTIRTCGPEYVTEWEEVDPMLGQRSRMAVAVAGSRVVVAGGFDGNSNKDTVLVLETDETGYPSGWSVVASLPGERADMGLAAVGSTIVAFGGHDGSGPRSEVWVAAMSGSGNIPSWEETTPLTTGMWGSNAVSLDGRVYAIGGNTGSAVSTVLRAKPNEVWTAVSPLPSPLYRAGVATDDGGVWVLGGAGEFSTADNALYGAISGGEVTWGATRPLSYRVEAPGVAASDGMVFVSGGLVDGYDPTDFVLVGMPDADKEVVGWEPVAPLPETRVDHAMVAVGNHLIVMGGKKRTGELPRSTVYVAPFCIEE